MKRNPELTHGNMKYHMIRLAVPLIWGNILQQTYNTIDAFVIGKYASKLEFSAVGVASSIMNLMIFIIVGACTGASIIFSELYGGKQIGKFRTEHFLVLTFGMLVTVCMSILAVLFLIPILHLTQTPVEIIDYTVRYLRIVLIGLPFVFLYNLYNSLLRATGNTSISLYILLVSVAINLGLDLYMVGTLHMGIAGAAWATIFSQAVSAVCSVVIFHKMLPDLRCYKNDCRWDKSLMQKTLHFSIVTSVHQASLYIGKLMVQSAVNTAGTEMIAAYTAAIRIEGYANSFADSGAAATSVIIAQNHGAGKQDRVKKGFGDSFVLLLSLGILCSAILYPAAPNAAAMILGHSDGLSYQNAVSYLRIIAFFYPFCFIGNTFAGYLDGIEKVSIPFIGAAGHIALRVILSWIFISYYKLPAVAFATGIGWVLVNLFWGGYLFVLWHKA
ncbi:MAG: MATE family efflux transporter [Bacillus sp. (in: Bacteria)]|nr:MATE family efflux transporter [Bacillus sp. (in: firmicutes)]MCM1427659.1 MATE family efflux transporter [Eubacterium sp.]